MTILSRVCAEFHDRSGRVIFSVSPADRFSFLEAPEAIQEDPLFHLMLQDGSLEAVRSVRQQKALESDPAGGTSADGKKTTAAEPAAEGKRASRKKDTAPAPDGASPNPAGGDKTGAGEKTPPENE